MNNKNIFLIGMMGSGKSTVGHLLSSKIKIPFFDMDNELEKIIDMSINEIFANYGEERFRLIESSFFNEITKVNQYVYATGGGIILNKNNQNILKKSGTTFFLDTSRETLIHRLENDTRKRQILQNNIPLNIPKILNKRYNLYSEVAHCIIKTDKLNPVDITNQIIKYCNA